MNKKWVIKDKISDKDISKFPEINPVILQLLFSRNLKTKSAIDQFLSPDYSKDVHDPFLFSDMEKVVARIYEARHKKQKVMIFGDYDADGVSGSTILSHVFEEINLDYEAYMPNREEEGYGLNKKAIEQFAKDKFSVLITVDCGISNKEEVDYANSLGIDVIITDHHHIPEDVPKAFGIIHPGYDDKYPFKFLAGGGVAFKLAQGILKDEKGKGLEKWLLDFVAISTVADMVPLLGENRTLVKYGLIVLNKTKNLGLKKIFEVSGISSKEMDAMTIGWQIAPRINAAGRMEHANSAYQLLTTDNIEEAIMIAHSLDKRNTERRSLTDKISTEALKQLTKVKDEPILFVKGKNWPTGIIGLVASKIVRKYSRPVLVLGEQKDKLVASCRSIDEFNLIESLNVYKKYFIKYGGHKGAAGFSMKPENYEDFKKDLTKYAGDKLKDVELVPKVEIDLEIKLSQINWDLLNILLTFEPYGQKNVKPKFLLKKLKLKSFDTVGNDGKHLRLLVSDGDIDFKVIAFSFGSRISELKVDLDIDIVCEIGINEWNGNKQIQLSLIDFKI
ncbi:single-stranded-DNA-specific exonuclease RecJ [bacterium]|jgi:single-stranded-DNA-specific exonuclease|nr:single-stranded-DNA-specific exonuclease RecJ [bacterium]MBT4334996.1 single-stranded-DNA-specific exonuclease RecJ [bacterium]MBT4496055.1 single-stranded-DNA-specific exonuclease RecJ [bacterium]MBT4764016.1 single-stranded-DNA-specific exonuclease RecJ [bacterium]MBT5401388.1 single-stranded-DNA-specific exonuclease RecJ [bacterium]